MINAKEFGVSVAWQGATIEALTHVAVEAERLGFGYMWIPEAWSLECFAAVSHLLNKTRNIRIGSGILNVYSRSAALIGMGCATMEQIAPGRFILGLGSSGRILIESFHGVKFDRPLQRTKEYVDVIRKVAGGESVEYSGDLLKLSRFRLFTKPLKNPLEIYLGAIGEKNLRLAGEIGDGAIAVMYPLSRLGGAAGLLGEGKKLFAYLPMILCESREELEKSRELVSKNIAFYVASMGKYYSSNLSRLGFGDNVKKIIAADGAASSVSEEFLDELSLIGTRDAILEKIAKLPESVRPVFTFSLSTPEEVMSAVKSLRLITA